MYKPYGKKRYKTGIGHYYKVTGTRQAFKRFRQPYKGFIRKSGYYGRYIRSRINSKPELKFFDTSTAITTINATGETPIISINRVPVGTAENEMVGRQITIKRISGTLKIGRNGQITTDLTTAEQCDVLRVCLMLDRQCNGSSASWLDVFEKANISSFRNLENSHRFKILKEWFCTSTANLAAIWNPTTGQAGFPNAQYFRSETFEFIKFSIPVNIKIEYSPPNTARSISDIKTNNIFMLAISTDGSSYLGTDIRIRYTDS